MSQSIKDVEKTWPAAADLSTKRYFIVKQNSSKQVALGAAATDSLIGVLQNKPKQGEGALVRFGGTSKVVASAAISVGARVTSTAAGKAVATTTTNDTVIGIALEAAGADGDIIEIQLVNFRY